MINITSDRGKQKARVEILRAMTLLEASGARDIQPILSRQFLSAARSVAVGSYNVNAAVNSQRRRMIVAFKRNYRRTATVFNQMAMGKLGAAGAVAGQVLPVSDIEELIPEVKGSREEFWSALNKSINKDTAKRVTNVGKTTKKRIQNVIRRGMESKLSNREIAKNLTGISAIANPKRAKMIARTETHGAAMHAIDESVKTAGVKTTKDWIGANDARSRDIPGRGRIHVKAMATQKKIPDDKPFIVGGEKLMYPGDFAGSGWNIIYCRCGVIYNVVKAAVRVEKPRPMAPGMSAVGKTSKNFEKEISNGLKSVPEKIKKEMTKAGEKIVIGHDLKTIDPNLFAGTPRGWPAGSSWENVIGSNFQSKRTTYMAEYFKPLGSDSFAKSAGVRKAFLHEYGHAVDDVLGAVQKVGTLSHTGKFRLAYQADVVGLTSRERGVLKYFLQSGRAGREEVFAEAFGILHKGGSTGSMARHLFKGKFTRSIKLVEDMVAGIVKRPKVLIPKDIVKMKSAIRTHKPATRKIQQIAEKNEKRLAERILGKQLGDNEPFDVIMGTREVPTHLIEVKTIVRGATNKITMHGESLKRKLKQVRKFKGSKAHTVVFDERTGKIYYRKGLGSFRIKSMEEVTEERLKTLFLKPKPAPPVSVSARVLEIEDEVLKFGNKTKHEMSHMINAETGEKLKSIQGSSNRIDLAKQLSASGKKKGSKWIQIHNHPSENAFSDLDIIVFGRNKQVSEMRVITPGKKRYVVRKKAKDIVMKNADSFQTDYLDEMLSMTTDVARDAVKKGITLTSAQSNEIVFLKVNKRMAKKWDYIFEVEGL